MNEWLNISRSRNAKLLGENSQLKKIIAGQKRKIKEMYIVEINEELEMPKLLKKEIIREGNNLK